MIGQIILCFSALHKRLKKDTQIVNPKLIQNFLFLYIDAKMRTEKMILQVGKEVEIFLNTLEKPLLLNEMRVMKDANYLKFRQILSDTSLYGDEVLKIMRERSKDLGLSAKAYDGVYEGIWDLYCKKPQTPDISAKKLDPFIQRIKLLVPPADVVDEEGNVVSSVSNLPLKAIVRIRIPLKRPVEVVPDPNQDPDDNGKVFCSLIKFRRKRRPLS